MESLIEMPPPLFLTEDAYLREQLITYIGNKRSLLGHIESAINIVKRRLSKDKLSIFDAFAGSGVVSRLAKRHSERLISNDIEKYAAVTARCHLRNRSTINIDHLAILTERLNQDVDSVDLPCGFIEELYAAKDDENAQSGERLFYTRSNARRLDNYRRLLDAESRDDRDMLLGPLLSKASVHANTSGVFKGFHKDRHSKRGRLGGTNRDALSRIARQIVLEVPLLSQHECDVEVFQEDANDLALRLNDLDLVYLDPPYNQHPYGSNYFMLNLLVDYERPMKISNVSGIPVDWMRSDYNVRSRSFSRFTELVRSLATRFILVSFNDEGFISPRDMHDLLSAIGKVKTIQIPYNTYRGSRNLRQRKIHVTESLFLVETQ